MTEPPGDAPFLSGGPFFRFQERVRRKRPRWSPLESAIAFVLLTWAPPVILSALKGPEFVRGFLEDSSNHFRLLLAGPVAILAAPLVDKELGRAARYFVESGVVRGEDSKRFQDLLRGVAKMRDSLAAEALVLGFTYILNWWLIRSTVRSEVGAPMEWFARSSTAWLWYGWLSRPLLHFLLFRWLWRIAIWTIFLGRTARLPLELSAAHPDRAGGLGFLAQAHTSFGLVALPFSVVWAAGWRERFLYAATPPDSLKVSLTIFVAVALAILYGPLTVFSPQLFRLRQRAMLEYGNLGGEYCRRFERRWLANDAPETESLLGTADIQSFADLQNTVGAVRAMRPIPLDRWTFVALALGIVVPLLPLLDLVFPFREVLRRALMPFL